MARKRSSKTTLIFFVLLSIVAFVAFVPVFASLPSLSSHSHDLHLHLRLHQRQHRLEKSDARKFEIAEDMFWKDGKPFQIIGGDLHYFRILPEYWEDRLLRAKALGLNTIQTYIPWNLHEPEPGKLVFEGIADLVSFLKLCQKLGLLVMLRAGPYICAEWDLGGFPAWLLAIEPDIRLRSSDPAYLQLVEGWWGVLLPKVAPLLYGNGGPIIMVQIENEFGSYGDDKAYLRHLVKLARGHLGEDIILYTTDGGSRETLEKGTLVGDDVFSAVDFTTGDDPWPIFELQKEFNSPGKSPPLSSEFYTGWLTHWGEKIARTDADFTAAALEKILSRNGSVVLYMAHGGTNFGFYNGANTGADESDYKPDLTSYDYDAPITESGDVDNAKFKAIRRVVGKYSSVSLPSFPSSNKKTGYGFIQLQKTRSLFDLLDGFDSAHIVEAENPTAMEYFYQMFGFLLYVSEYASKAGGNKLFIPKVHDRAQVFISCPSRADGGRVSYVGTIERWSNQAIYLPNAKCVSNTSLFILVENMGRVNYGPYLFDRKGILSSVYVDGRVLNRWKMIPIPFQNLNEVPKFNPVIQVASEFPKVSIRKKLEHKSEDVLEGPSFYTGHFSIDKTSEVTDTFISFRAWGKGIAFVNEFNIGRYWPTSGENLAQLMYSVMMTGYMFRNAQYRLELQQSIEQAALPEVQEEKDVPEYAPGTQKNVSGEVIRWNNVSGPEKIDAKKYIELLEAEIEELNRQVGRKSANGQNELLEFLKSLEPQNLKELTSSAGEDVVFAMNTFIKRLLAVSDPDQMKASVTETSAPELAKLLCWLMVVGYSIRNIEVRFDMERVLGTPPKPAELPPGENI